MSAKTSIASRFNPAAASASASTAAAVAVAVAFAFAILVSPACRAAADAEGGAEGGDAGGVALTQAYAWDQNIDMFFAGYLEPSGLGCRISGHPAEIAQYGYVADAGVAVRTTILLDASESIPPTIREYVKSFMGTLIARLGGNEQCRIVAFGEGVDVLCGFSADKDELAAAVGRLGFSAQKSMVYDALINTLPDSKPNEDQPCLYRTIMVTGGIDDALSMITKEELYLRLQSDLYPIAAIEASAEASGVADKDMVALARVSGGKYFNLNAQTDVGDLSSYLSPDALFWIRAIVPGALLDGITRQVDVMDGVKTFQFDIKFPIPDIPISPAPTPTEEPPTPTPTEEPPEPSPTEPLSTEPSTTEPSATEPSTTEPSTADTRTTEAPTDAETITTEPAGFQLHANVLAALVGAGAGIAITIGVVAAKSISRARKRKAQNQGAQMRGGVPLPVCDTEAIMGLMRSDNGIRLRDMGDAGKVWELSVANGVLVGRDAGCQVCIEEKSVARRQCRIYLENSVALIENLSNTNITRLNGAVLGAPAEIKSGDTIKCGRVVLSVDALFDSTQRNTDISGKTVYIDL